MKLDSCVLSSVLRERVRVLNNTVIKIVSFCLLSLYQLYDTVLTRVRWAGYSSAGFTSYNCTI